MALYVMAAFSVGAPASASEYFPLQVGKQWIYQQCGAAAGEPVVVQVLEGGVFGEREYFLVAGLSPSAAWLRLSEDGTLYGLNRESGTEAVWAVFSKGVGETYSTAMHPCSPAARVDSVFARVEVPAGAFQNAVAMGYPTPSCADTGLQGDSNAPDSGLVQRTMTTFAGPQTMRRDYALVGDKTVLSRPEVLSGLSLDHAVCSGRLNVPLLTARIMFRVRQPEPLELDFPSEKRLELVLKDNEGREVHRWSDGRRFALQGEVERFGPGERNWPAEVRLQTRDGNELPPGKYTAECRLTTAGERRYAATAGFEIAAWRAPTAGLSGNWGFEARTGEGWLRAGLALQVDGKRLSASLRIDNHFLRGEGETDGTRFDVLLVHADGSGPGHGERLRLTGKLEGDRILGSFNNGTDRGDWTGGRSL